MPTFNIKDLTLNSEKLITEECYDEAVDNSLCTDMVKRCLVS